MTRPTPLKICTLLAPLLLIACSSPSNNPPPTTTPPSPESEVKAAYEAYWEMLERLSASPDPEDDEIASRASGTARDEVVAGLSRLADEGRIARPGPAYEHRVLSVNVSGREAQVTDCAIDDSVILDGVTGEVVGGGEAATGLLEVTLSREAGRWRVEQVRTVKTWPGVAACDNS